MAGDVYRRTATIRAVQWFKLGDHPDVILRKRWPEPRDECSVFWLGALSGGFVVRPGDWIVTDELGRQSPMEPDKFAATYELADLSRIAEREACAMVAEEALERRAPNPAYDQACNDIAAAIRARGERVDDISYAGLANEDQPK